MKKEDFDYLPEEDLPVLVLAIEGYGYGDRRFPSFVLNDKRKFINVAHQTAGHACNQHYLQATILDPVDKFKKCMNVIAQYWLDSDAGVFDSPSLDQVEVYRSQLQTAGLDCNRTYRSLEEGFYPIDFSDKWHAICNDHYLPEDLDDFIVFDEDKPMAKLIGMVGRWRLVVLGPNCD